MVGIVSVLLLWQLIQVGVWQLHMYGRKIMVVYINPRPTEGLVVIKFMNVAPTKLQEEEISGKNIVFRLQTAVRKK